MVLVCNTLQVTEKVNLIIYRCLIIYNWSPAREEWKNGAKAVKWRESGWDFPQNANRHQVRALRSRMTSCSSLYNNKGNPPSTSQETSEH